MEPVKLPMPPNTTITRYEMEALKSNLDGSNTPTEWAYSAPATPAKNAEIVNALIL